MVSDCGASVRSDRAVIGIGASLIDVSEDVDEILQTCRQRAEVSDAREQHRRPRAVGSRWRGPNGHHQRAPSSGGNRTTSLARVASSSSIQTTSTLPKPARESRDLTSEDLRLRFRFVTADGDYRWVEAHASPYRKDDGSVDGVVSVVRDISSGLQPRTHCARVSANSACSPRMPPTLSSDSTSTGFVDGCLAQSAICWGGIPERFIDAPLNELITLTISRMSTKAASIRAICWTPLPSSASNMGTGVGCGSPRSPARSSTAATSKPCAALMTRSLLATLRRRRWPTLPTGRATTSSPDCATATK